MLPGPGVDNAVAAAAENPVVHAKLSGLYPEEDPRQWSAQAIEPFVERALDVFGAPRLMYGGDWPISLAAGGYDDVFTGLMETVAHLDEHEREQILSGTARRCYRLDEQLLAHATAFASRRGSRRRTRVTAAGGLPRGDARRKRAR